MRRKTPREPKHPRVARIALQSGTQDREAPLAGFDPVEVEKISIRQLEPLFPERSPRAPAGQHRQDRLDMGVSQIPRRAEEGFDNRHSLYA